MLKIIAGLVSHDAGDVSVGGQAPREGRHDIGFMLQQSVLMPWLDVSKNVELPFVIARRRTEETEARVAELLELVGLSDVATMNPWELSGGMQQRVALARALALDPGVMLMDEPFSALDEFKREYLNVEVAQMADALGKTTLLVTHSIGEAVLMSDRIIALGREPGTGRGRHRDRSRAAAPGAHGRERAVPATRQRGPRGAVDRRGGGPAVTGSLLYRVGLPLAVGAAVLLGLATGQHERPDQPDHGALPRGHRNRLRRAGDTGLLLAGDLDHASGDALRLRHRRHARGS